MPLPFARTDLHVDVGRTDVGANERLHLAIDVAALLRPGQAISAPSARMLDRQSGSDVSSSMIGTATVEGTVITVPVFGFDGGRQYRLEVSFSPAADQVRETIWDLDCVK